MILICGIPSEPSLGMVVEQLNKIGVPYLVFNQRRFDEMRLGFQINNGKVTGWMEYKGERYHLDQFTAIYSRLMDFHFLPELEKDGPDSPRLQYCRALHDALIHWSEIAPCRVVNRSGAMGSNYSKPFQAQLIRKHGFLIPETLISNDPNLVYAFRRQYKRVIYKSISSIRSIVQVIMDEDMERLGQIRWCPVQFQEFVDGINVRVHTIGQKAITTSIRSAATDYRYAYLEGEQEQLEAIEIPDTLADKCIHLTKSLGLSFAGIDLKVTPENKVYCLEVNPSPAFNYYETRVGQPIARAVAEYLAGAD